MSADKKNRRAKRTHKAGGPGVQPVSPRSSDNGVPSESESMPQPEGPGVAQEDRTNTEEQGGNIMSEERKEEKEQSAYHPKPSLKDRLGLTKESLIHIGMAVIIAVIISAVVFTQAGVSQGDYNTEQAQQAQSIATQGSEIASNDGDISDLQDDFGAINEQYSGVANTVALHTGSIESLGGRMDTLGGNFTALQDDFAAVCSPPEAYLTGNFTSGNLTIHAEASEAGDFTANVHLVFSPPLWLDGGNSTIEDVLGGVSGASWLMPTVAYNGTTWGVTAVWWNIGTFALAADTEKTITVLFGGLTATPSFAYVEIYPALK